MAKWVYNGVADWGLIGGIQQVAIRVGIATAAAVAYADYGSYSVGTLAIASANFTVGTGDTNGRKITLGAATIVVGTSGTVTHVLLAGTAGSGTLVLAGTCAPTAVTAGGTVILAAWDCDEINDVT